MKRTAFFISDSTGITTEGLGHSLLSQFDQIEFIPITIPYVNTIEMAEQTLARINQTASTDQVKPIVFSSLVNPDIRKIVSSCQGVFMDIFDLFIPGLEKELQTKSSHQIGKSHGVSNLKVYESRIEAIQFALDLDDGSNTKNYDLADVIIVGVSRSGKTPTSLYLAIQFGIRAANYPFTEEDLVSPGLPASLKKYQSKLFGLIISPQRLHQIREERMPNSRYASMPQCQLELKRMETLCRQHSIPYLNTTTYSIEEIATKIIETFGITRRLG